jgi:septal ring factor EnvC (AmiA/AmiB activator)
MPWLTYAEISDAFGINGNSARALVRRKRWPRQPGNDGATRVAVPDEELASRTANGAVITPAEIPADPPVSPPARTPDSTPAIDALARTISRLEDDLKQAREEAATVPALQAQVAAAEAALTSATARAATAEQDLAEQRQRTDDLVRRLSDLSTAMLDVERERISRAARPWWRRLVG